MREQEEEFPGERVNKDTWLNAIKKELHTLINLHNPNHPRRRI